jgi:hypothetical protein
MTRRGYQDERDGEGNGCGCVRKEERELESQSREAGLGTRERDHSATTPLPWVLNLAMVSRATEGNKKKLNSQGSTHNHELSSSGCNEAGE